MLIEGFENLIDTGNAGWGAETAEVHDDDALKDIVGRVLMVYLIGTNRLRDEMVIVTDNIKVEVLHEEALILTTSEEADEMIRVVFLYLPEKLLDAWELLNLIEYAWVNIMHMLNAHAKELGKDIHNITIVRNALFQFGIAFLHAEAETLQNQFLLIGKHLIQRTLRHAHSTRNIVHLHFGKAFSTKQLECLLKDALVLLPSVLF